MKVFLTGGTGFIGSHFINAAHRAAHEIWALRRPDSRPSISLDREPRWLEGTLEAFPVDSLEHCEVIVHLAAAGVDPRMADWEGCFQCNLCASLRLWRAGVERGIRKLVICGSCFEYGKTADRYEKIPVSASLEPVGAYAASKAAASMAAIGLAQEQGLALTILRPFHVFGEGEPANRFWPSLRAAAMAGKDFPMTAGDQIRDFVPVSTVANVFVDMIQSKPADGAIMRTTIRNIGTGRAQTLFEFASGWWQRWNAKGVIQRGALPYRLGELMRLVPSAEQLCPQCGS